MAEKVTDVQTGRHTYAGAALPHKDSWEGGEGFLKKLGRINPSGTFKLCQKLEQGYVF